MRSKSLIFSWNTPAADQRILVFPRDMLLQEAVFVISGTVPESGSFLLRKTASGTAMASGEAISAAVSTFAGNTISKITLLGSESLRMFRRDDSLVFDQTSLTMAARLTFTFDMR